MRDLAFGLTTTLAGMGVTLATLFLLTLLIRLMNRIFRADEEKPQKT